MDQMTLISPTLDFTKSVEGDSVEVSKSHLSFSEERIKIDPSLEMHLEALKATNKQQLENLELQHQAGLEKRVLQNSLLSTSTEWILKTSLLQECISNHPGRDTEKHRHRSSKLILQNFTSNGIKASSTVTSSKGMVRERQKKPLPQETKKAKEEADLAECQKQFCVVPIPEHISEPLYDDLIREQERLRKEGREQRKDFLLTMQKPFTFHKREEKKQERLKEMASSNQSEKTEPVIVRKPIPQAVSDPRFSERLKEQELQRKIRIQMRAQETLKASSAPIQRQEHSADSHSRIAQKTKSKMLSYLEQNPSFRPKTNTAVPDFDKLYQAFQQKAMEKAHRRDVTHCKPFQLRTSTLQPRHRSPENSLKSGTTSLKRSSSFGGLTSLSLDTLPTYITDAARKRSMAVRRSLELKDLKEQENTEWMRQHIIKSQAMSRAVAMRAKAMDPHKSLKEVYQEKLKQHRQADLERVKDYQKELKEIRTRVTARPYLFEQVSQKNAKSNAERRYRTTLEQAGLDENFVRSKGETDKPIHGSKSVDDESEDEEHNSNESETHLRKWGRHVKKDEKKEGNVETKEEELC
ncbi:LOW QUALITY PROTEIN: protein FAM161B [Myxocyprinus asiaticus]|uniref:LOW QUALITY PROTEIN: protein FAM161B n=1 Tax=Myxocyprinus asiaticus TaxID=70543 RepID=UPI002221516B|nr:LOW QUALITY PROTEIN: protein FAM161B [Myxocyprinus asiaticus]